MKAIVEGVVASNILQLHVSIPTEAYSRVLELSDQSLVQSLHITLVRLDDLGVQARDVELPMPPKTIDLLDDIFIVDTGVKQACYLVATPEMQDVLRSYALECADKLGLSHDAVEAARVYHVTVSNAGGGDVRSSVGSPWEFNSKIYLGITMKCKSMLPGFASRVFDILANDCAVPDNGSNRERFVYEYEVPRTDEPSGEWRFGSTHGFSGKFRYPALTVDANREHVTEQVSAVIEHVNKRLAEIKRRMALKGWSADD